MNSADGRDNTTANPNALPAAASNCLCVNEVQKGNPVLKHVRNVRWEFLPGLLPDYAMGTSCALFVTVRFHFRHPKHIVRRIQEIGRSYRLRVLLVLADDEHNLPALQELNKIAFVSEFTLLVAWSNLECARYLETLKLYEGKSAASIQQKEETEFTPRMAAVLTQVRSVNKSDVVTLLDMCGSLAGICAASEQRLQLCPGVGDKKVKRLRAALHQPFIRRQRQRRDDEGAAAATGASAAPDTAASHCSGNQQDDAQASAAEEEERNGVTASVTAPSIATMVYNCDHSHPPRPTVAVAVADAAVDGFEGAQRRVDTND